jgi:hypothetical protein
MRVGTYQVRIVHPQYGQWENEVRLRKDQLSSAFVDFSRTFKITVTCHNAEGRRIPDGELFLDGLKVKHYGFPCELSDLRVGLHTVEVRCEGYKSSSVRKNYDEPADQNVRFVLTKDEM